MLATAQDPAVHRWQLPSPRVVLLQVVSVGWAWSDRLRWERISSQVTVSLLVREGAVCCSHSPLWW